MDEKTAGYTGLFLFQRSTFHRNSNNLGFPFLTKYKKTNRYTNKLSPALYTITLLNIK